MKNSKNLIEFFRNTKERFAGKCGKAFVATLISVLPFAVILFGAMWLSQLVHFLFVTIAILAIVCIGCMQVGHIRYIRLLANNENPKLSILFSGFMEKNTLFYLFLGIVVFVIYFISSLLLIVPLFFAIGLFSMVFYFVEHHKYDSVLDALSVTQKRMRKQKGNMFAYKTIFYIAYVVLLVLFAIGLVFFYSIPTPAVSVALIVVLHIAVYVLFSYITMLFGYCNYNFFMEVLEYHERKSKKNIMPEIPEDEEKKEESVVIEKVSVDAKKPATTKTPAKTTTTKKPATAKTSAKATRSTTKKDN